MVLGSENVFHVPVVVLRQKVVAVFCINELGGHPHAISRLPNAPLHHRIHLELPADIADVLAPSLEGDCTFHRLHGALEHAERAISVELEQLALVGLDAAGHRLLMP